MTYLEQLEVIKTIPIREGDTKVIQCPFCGGLKKLSVSKVDGQLKWYCFRASCNGKGIYQGKRSLQAAKNYLEDAVQQKTREPQPIPSITTPARNHQPALDYLEQNNSLEAYEAGYIDVRYAPAEDRVLFCTDTGAVGRSLKKYGPKWLTYGVLNEGIHVGKGSTAVIVEDTPSACSVSRVDGFVGVALLGTRVSTCLKKSLKKYNACYLVLDKDASSKAISLSRSKDKSLLIRFTTEDLKHLSVNQLLEVLDNDI